MEKVLWEKELWTQQEVADYFRIVPGTVLNWRKRGLLSYVQAPGSSRVFFYRDEVIRFRDENTTPKKGGDRKGKTQPLKEMPDISTTQRKQWRI